MSLHILVVGDEPDERVSASCFSVHFSFDFGVEHLVQRRGQG
jgi:hypothetical protein